MGMLVISNFWNSWVDNASQEATAENEMAGKWGESDFMMTESIPVRSLYSNREMQKVLRHNWFILIFDASVIIECDAFVTVTVFVRDSKNRMF